MKTDFQRGYDEGNRYAFWYFLIGAMVGITWVILWVASL